MKTPEQWFELMGSKTTLTKLGVEISKEIREYLTATTTDGASIHTKTLAEALWPERTAAGPDGMERRLRFIDTILRLARTHLMDDCAERTMVAGARFYGRLKGRWLWHAPRVVPRLCPHCKGVLP